MPSLHFAASLMAALLLTEAGPVEGASAGPTRRRWASPSSTSGEHYVIDLLAGAALVLAVRKGEPLRRAGRAGA